MVTFLCGGDSGDFAGAGSRNGATHISQFVVGCGVLVGLLAYIRKTKKQHKDLEESRSRFFFEQAKAGLEKVCAVLGSPDVTRPGFRRNKFRFVPRRRPGNA
jgi:hypothetical protein